MRRGCVGSAFDVPKVMAIASQPPDVITLGPADDALVLHLDELSVDARPAAAASQPRRSAPGRDVTDLIARHA
ncbi:MAG: hypothetical protein ACT4P1_07530 [Sporichthyaceae bacterium]